MFYCFGENAVLNMSVGEGATPLDACKAWADGDNLHALQQELTTWNPTIIEGVPFRVNIMVSDPVFEFLK